MVLRVKVEDVAVITVKPRISQTIYQYIIVARDDFGHSHVYFVDADKYEKQKFIEAVRMDFAGRYGIPVQSVEVEFLVEPPRVSS